VGGVYEVLSWMIYALAALMMVVMIVAAIVAGLALRFVADFLRELGDSREEDDAQHAQDGRKSLQSVKARRLPD
jgi:type II secretory pathway component PulK